MWIAADFECKNISIYDNQVDSKNKLIVYKPVAISCKIVKNSCYDFFEFRTKGPKKNLVRIVLNCF